MEQVEPLFDRNVECIHCKHKFTSKKIRSRFIKVLEYDTDFYPRYANPEINSLFYNILVCPSCGFSFTDEFNKYFAPGTRELIEENITAKWGSHNFGGTRTIYDAIKAYKLASYSATLKKEKHVTIAGIYLRIAWLYRELGDDSQEIRFLKLALHQYENSYSTDDFKGTQMSDVRLLYLAGEISRRVADHSAAAKYFSKVIEKQKQTVETKLVQMAKEQWQLIRQAKKDESHQAG
ncbi:DUF2225 domain-containing protein [Peribacillus sp. SCS-155]|uniref:DUF2225 domain-containing protein n=1 Tax=Peribacillus sedimenti TaxID=3115297 RepID=UPI0039061110